MDIKNVAVLLTDTHLFEKRTMENSIIDCNYEYVYAAFEKSISLAKENGLTKVIHAGDFFDNRKQQSQNLMEMAFSIFELFQKENMKLVLVTGNHDKTDYRSPFSFLSAFKNHPNLQLIEDWGFYDDHENKIRFIFISYFDNDIYVDYLKIAKENMSETYKNVLITHIGIHGALKNSGEKDESSLNFHMFEDFNKVLIGHYHNYGSFSNQKIVYIGSALQHNFGEDDKKGIILLNNAMKIQRVKTNFKEYVNIHVDVSTLDKQSIDDMLKTVKEEEAHYKVHLLGDTNLVKAFNKTILEDAGIKVVSKANTIEIPTVDEDVQISEEHSTESILENFKVFCEKHSYKEKEGLEILIPAINK